MTEQEEIKLLQEQAVFLEIVFPDNTRQLIQTTLNKTLLASLGVKPRRGFYFNLKSLEFVAFRDDAIEINVLTEYPNYEVEVLNFACRFM